MTDDPDRAGAASDLLWQHSRAGTRLACLPEEIRPETRSQGYAIQALLEPRSAAPLFGWKIAATSKAGQDHIGVDRPLAGRLFSENVFANGRSSVGRQTDARRGAGIRIPHGAPCGSEGRAILGCGGLRRRRNIAPGYRDPRLPLHQLRRRRRAAADRGQCLRTSLRARPAGTGAVARLRPSRA